jgi:hypothetical protein
MYSILVCSKFPVLLRISVQPSSQLRVDVSPHQHPEASIPDNHSILWEDYSGDVCDFACEETFGYEQLLYLSRSCQNNNDRLMRCLRVVSVHANLVTLLPNLLAKT